MRYLLLFLASTCFAQLPTVPLPQLSNASTFFPTNAANDAIWWFDLILPGNGTYGGSTGATHPANDGQDVLVWTNWIVGAVDKTLTADQTAHPTNFVSGGGGSLTSPRMLFTSTISSTRMTVGVWPTTTNKATFVIVANCTSSTGSDNLTQNGTADPYFGFTALGLRMNQGSTLSTVAGLQVNTYYVLTFVFAAGASSHIDTNGVAMATGTAGTDNIGTQQLAQEFNGTGPSYRGNICRVWAWDGVLSSTDLANAVAQCRKDFGI